MLILIGTISGLLLVFGGAGAVASILLDSTPGAIVGVCAFILGVTGIAFNVHLDNTWHHEFDVKCQRAGGTAIDGGHKQFCIQGKILFDRRTD